MSPRNASAAVALALVFAAGSSARAARAASDAEAHVAADSTTVQARRHYLLPWKRLRPGALVPIGTEVTCEARCAIALSGGSRVELAPQARIVVGDAGFVFVLPRRPIMHVHKLELREGAIDLATRTSERPHAIVVAVGGATAAVWSGSARMISNGGRVGIASSTAKGRVSGKGAPVELAAGQAVTVEGGKLDAVRDAVVAPEWRSSCPEGRAIALADGGRAVPVGFCWAPVSGTSRYHVELSSSASFERLIGSADVEAPASGFRTHPLDAGRYFARVRAIDEMGIASETSAVRALGVVPVSLPTAGAQLGPTLVAPASTVVAFGRVAGLEASIGGGRWMPAPPSIRADVPSWSLRFRFQDDPASETAYVLEQRTLRAKVSIAPRLARWPGDTIAIAVELQDPSGHIDPTKFAPALEVTLNMKDEPVEWERHGSRYATKLSPRPIAGPAVVRVVARDPSGIELGRGVADITGAAR